MNEGEIPVASSNIATVRYMEGERTLQVRSRGGRACRYHRVPRAVYDGLMGSPSQGKCLHANIVGRFDATEVGA